MLAGNPIESFQGSSDGTAVVAESGAYEVIVLGISKPNEPHIYTLRFSENCIGSITADETKTCTITNTYEAGISTSSKTENTRPNVGPRMSPLFVRV